jgi:hypothetical protein
MCWSHSGVHLNAKETFVVLVNLFLCVCVSESKINRVRDSLNLKKA